ncbi:MAG TPA: hypothetical protein VN229_11370 [Terriglobales bacterium]|nr:hypothetical protein [Terriglobales bacterium]
MSKFIGVCFCSVLFALPVFLRSAQADDFGDKFHQGCVSSAVASVEQQGIKADAAFQEKINAVCDCGLTQIRGQFTATELLSLSGPNPDPTVADSIKPIMQQCMKENFK